MFTFICGILILFAGYIFYSNYVQNQFEPDERETPSQKLCDNVDYVPLPTFRNQMIQLLNIAGLGPILGALQGILFGPVAFILIPLGCIFMGAVHDYFSGMISVRNNGLQITELIKKYLGVSSYKFFIVIVSIMLILLSTVFVYTSGDIIAQRFFAQNDFSLSNPIIVVIYCIIAAYYIVAAMFPVDKIIGRLYPLFGALLIVGTALIFSGFLTNQIQLQNIDFRNLNLHKDNLPIIPLFFMTVSCGLLSGFHSTQSTIISRTIKNEFDGKKIFYGMMCLESLIAMIWAAAAMSVYNSNLVPLEFIGTANAINIIADKFVPHFLAFIVTSAVVILPITSGDTALRGLRLILSDAFLYKQNKLINRLIMIIPISCVMFTLLIWAKSSQGSFSLIWRYFTFVNQLIAIPTFLFSTIYLYQKKKNFYITMLPGLFYVFITASFICNAKIGLNMPFKIAYICGFISVILCIAYLYFKIKNSKNV